jgi:protein-arginine kinase
MKDETLDKGWEKEFNKEVIDYFWDMPTVCGTMRLSLSHIEKVKQFITNLLAEQKAEIIERVKGTISLRPTHHNGEVFMLPVGWLSNLEKDIINLIKE